MVYVSDYGSDCVQKFDSNGQFLSKLGSSGDGEGQFFAPAGLAVDSAGNLYVADSENGRIQKFGSDGQFLAQWGSTGFDDGSFVAPFGVAVDDCGNIWWPIPGTTASRNSTARVSLSPHGDPTANMRANSISRWALPLMVPATSM